MMTGVPAAACIVAARVLARRITVLAQGAPEGSRFGVHLCLGDLGHRAMGSIADTAPLVQLANAVARAWPAHQELRYVHLPLAHGERPPSTDPAFYAPLGRLRLGAGTRVFAGFAHEAQDVPTQFLIRDMIEVAVGRPVGISSSCGLGRRAPEAARALLDRIALLLPDQPAAPGTRCACR